MKKALSLIYVTLGVVLGVVMAFPPPDIWPVA
jgi:hypothetical protein